MVSSFIALGFLDSRHFHVCIVLLQKFVYFYIYTWKWKLIVHLCVTTYFELHNIEHVEFVSATLVVTVSLEQPLLKAMLSPVY